MKTRRRRLLSLVAWALPALAVAPWLTRRLRGAGVTRAAVPPLVWLRSRRIVPLDEKRIGPGDELAG